MISRPALETRFSRDFFNWAIRDSEQGKIVIMKQSNHNDKRITDECRIYFSCESSGYHDDDRKNGMISQRLLSHSLLVLSYYRPQGLLTCNSTQAVQF